MTRRAASHRFSNDLRYRDADHPDQTHITPGYVLDLVRADLGGSIGLDPCTTGTNPAGAARFYTAADDGLTRPWSGPEWAPAIFVNPPYGKAREPWVTRCMTAGMCGQLVALLIPAATDTRIFQRAVADATAVVFIQGRLKFGTPRPNGRQVAASHPSALIGWNTPLHASAGLGMAMRNSVPLGGQGSLFGQRREAAA